MKIRHRISYYKEDIGVKFRKFLIENNAKIIDEGSNLCIAHVFENEQNKKELYELLGKEDLFSYIEMFYSKREMEQAEWFFIHPKFRWEYPQPEDNSMYRSVTYDNSDFCNVCGSGLKQIGEFRIKKSPDWGTRNFLKINWIEDEIFISDYAKRLIEKSDLNGFNIANVLNSKSLSNFENIFQLQVNNFLEIPCIANMEQAAKEINKCKKCGVKKYILLGREYICHREAFDNLSVDIVKSKEVFGAGHICSRDIFISKKFRKLILQNSMERGIEFHPVFYI